MFNKQPLSNNERGCLFHVKQSRELTSEKEPFHVKQSRELTSREELFHVKQTNINPQRQMFHVKHSFSPFYDII